MKDDAVQAHPATFVALVLFTLVSLGLGVVANLVASKKAGFLKKYFLGNRSLGAFAVALTAAVMSGGTFLGFPSFVYKYGWIVGLWIASYMVAPLTVLGVLGKRIGHLARKTGAITLPDLFRERFGSPSLGLLTSLFIIFFLSCFLVAQFKAGGVLMKIVLPSSTYDWANVERPRGRDRPRLHRRPPDLHGDRRGLHGLRRLPGGRLDRRLPVDRHGYRRA